MPVDSRDSISRDYRILGLSPGTPHAEVKKAYRTLVKLWHPDRYQQKPDRERLQAEEKLKEITGAYHRIAKEHVLRERIRQAEERAARESEPEETPRREASSPRPESARRPRPPRREVPGIQTRRSRWLWFSVSMLSLLVLLAFAIPVAWMPLFSMLGDSSPERDMAAVKRFWETPQPESPPDPPSEVPFRVAKNRDIGLRPEPGRPLPGTFSIGSSQSEVFRIQGPPARIHGQTWVYGLSEVQFRDGRVSRYDNFDGSLRVSMGPGRDPVPDEGDFFTLGSSQDDVLLVQGNPTKVEGNKWYFGFSQVRFKDGRVEDFDNYFGNLKVRMAPSEASLKTTPGYFTIGSTPDQVLAVQGTPTKIQGGLWFYHFSNIQFRDGKVAQVVNSDGSLRFASPEDLNRADGRS